MKIKNFNFECKVSFRLYNYFDQCSSKNLILFFDNLFKIFIKFIEILSSKLKVLNLFFRIDEL